MRITICENKIELGQQAASLGRHCIKSSIEKLGRANVAFVTGTSQLGLLSSLRTKDLQWDKVNVFLLDEFVGLPDGHKASSEPLLTGNVLDCVLLSGSYQPS